MSIGFCKKYPPDRYPWVRLAYVPSEKAILFKFSEKETDDLVKVHKKGDTAYIERVGFFKEMDIDHLKYVGRYIAEEETIEGEKYVTISLKNVYSRLGTRT